ncbi:MAG: acyltransferase [Acidobacteria bacterium]|nr:acyltransferase [Acidobacteriota bacterium]
MPLPPLRSPSAPFVKLLAIARGLPAAVFLFTTLIAVNLLQAASLLIAGFSRSAFRRFNRWCANTWWGWGVSLARLLYRYRLRVTGSDVPLAENAIIVANHQNMPDITTLMAFARSKRRLGDLKWFVKDPIKYVPGVGWGMLFIGCLFVKRDWTADQTRVMNTFRHIREQRIPIWLMLFAEGTRVTQKKLEASRKYALSRGLRPLDHLLVPRTKGFASSVQGLRGHVTAVYDLTIGYVTGVPTIWQHILGYARVVHIHVRRTPIESLPDDEPSLSNWLIARFREKDLLLDEFYRTGAFPETEIRKPE